MTITIKAENEDDERKLQGKELEFRNVDSGSVFVLQKAGDILPIEAVRSFGDAFWLIGKLYVHLKYLENEVFHGHSPRI